MKKKNLTTAIALGLMAGVAATSTAMAQGTDSWTGFNAKLGISAQRIKDNKKDIRGIQDGWTTYDLRINEDSSSTAATASVSLGYDRKVSDKVVVGVFAEYDFGNDDEVSDSLRVADASYDYTLEDTTTVKNTLALGVKLGMLVNDDNLVYVTAGRASSKIDRRTRYTNNDYNTTVFADDDSREAGNFVGIGIEHKYRDNINFSLEYRHTSYGTVGRAYAEAYPFGGESATATVNESNARSSLSTDKITFGVSYNFY